MLKNFLFEKVRNHYNIQNRSKFREQLTDGESLKLLYVSPIQFLTQGSGNHTKEKTEESKGQWRREIYWLIFVS